MTWLICPLKRLRQWKLPHVPATRLDDWLGARPGWGLTLVIAWLGVLVQLGHLAFVIFFLT